MTQEQEETRDAVESRLSALSMAIQIRQHHIVKDEKVTAETIVVDAARFHEFISSGKKQVD